MAERLNLDQLTDVITECWDEQTSSTPDEWTPDKPERGQCVPTSLVVQDFMGGDIRRVQVTGTGINESHYYGYIANVTEDGIVDLTDSQYDGAPVNMAPAPVDLEAEGFATMRERLVANPNTNSRYELLRARVVQRLAERALL